MVDKLCTNPLAFVIAELLISLLILIKVMIIYTVTEDSFLITSFFVDYKFLGVMRRQFPGVPILGLTATATSNVLQDVKQILGIRGCLLFRASFNRKNLFYEVSSFSVISVSSCYINVPTKGQELIRYGVNSIPELELMYSSRIGIVEQFQN